MNRQANRRANAIDKDFTEVERNAAQVGSDLTTLTATLKLLVPFMHDNILNNKGDLTEADRVYFRDQVVPLFEPLLANVTELQELFDIHHDDQSVWLNNLNSYVAKYPNCLTEAESRYPAKG